MSTSTIVLILIIAAFFIFKQMTQVSYSKAQQLLKEEHMIVDVRTENEFSGMHVKGAINIPLDRLSKEAENKLGKNKDLVILLHCLSGSRSSFAKGILQGKGYKNVYNLGSLSRAKAIVEID